jgi:hypothetical protein
MRRVHIEIKDFDDGFSIPIEDFVAFVDRETHLSIDGQCDYAFAFSLLALISSIHAEIPDDVSDETEIASDRLYTPLEPMPL